MLTIALITVVFYFHPTAKYVTSYYRTIPILPETNGRVAEVFVGFSGDVEKGAPLFRLDDSKQKAALEAASKKIAEVDAAMIHAEADIIAAQDRFSRQGDPSSRHSMSWRPKKSCSGAMQVLSQRAKSKSFKSRFTRDRVT